MLTEEVTHQGLKFEIIIEDEQEKRETLRHKTFQRAVNNLFELVDPDKPNSLRAFIDTLWEDNNAETFLSLNNSLEWLTEKTAERIVERSASNEHNEESMLIAMLKEREEQYITAWKFYISQINIGKSEVINLALQAGYIELNADHPELVHINYKVAKLSDYILEMVKEPDLDEENQVTGEFLNSSIPDGITWRASEEYVSPLKCFGLEPFDLGSIVPNHIK